MQAMLLGLWLRHGEEPDDAPLLCRPTMWTLAWWQPNPDGTWTWCSEATDTDAHLFRGLFPNVG